jgi:uncharacterized damage-inducible protein DinB
MKNIFIEPDYYIELFEYDGWASDRILNALASSPIPQQDRALELISHLLRSQITWLSRVEGAEANPVALWERDTLDVCSQRRLDNTRLWLKMLRSAAAGDLNRKITYTNTRGETFTSEVREILTHVINHGTHHRAQVSSLLRSADVAPPPLDYIIYTRTSRSS